MQDRQEQLRCFNGKLFHCGERWKQCPTMTQWNFDMLPMCRSPSFFSAVRYNHEDWRFSNNDEGAVSVTFKGSRASKHNLVVAIVSELTDAFGYYILLGETARVFKPYSGGQIRAGQGYSSEGYKEMNPLAIYSIQNPSQNLSDAESELTSFTFIYDHGHFKLISGNDPNDKGALLLVEFKDTEALFGNRVFGFGLFGQAACNADTPEIVELQKWCR